jgi:zinc protease
MKRIIALAATAVALALIPFAGGAQMLSGRVTVRTLPNGLRLLMEENHSAPVISVNVCYRVGSKYERPGITGVSHILEHEMFKSTRNHPLGDFDRILTSAGADNNAYTWLDRTVYYETIAADKVDIALELEADRMRNMLFVQQEHADELIVVRNELEQSNDSPMSMLYDMMQATAFVAHPYGTPTIGWLDDVEHMTADDVRAYYDAYYQPDDALIVAVGDFNPDEMYAKVERWFGAIPASGVKLPRLTAEPPQQGQRRINIRRAGNADYLLIGWHTPNGGDPDAYALDVLSAILGGGRTSRLSQRLMEPGKAAYASASSGCFIFNDPSLFTVQAALNEGTSPEEAEKEVLEEIARIAVDGVTGRELARAKKQARASFIYRKDSVEDEADLLVTFDLASSYLNIDKYVPGIDAVTAEDVVRVVQKYLTADNSTVAYYLGIRGEGGVSDSDDDSDSDAAPSFKAAPKYRSGMQGSSSVPAVTPSTSPAGAVTVRQLQNGMQLIIKESHYNPTVSIAGRITFGSVNDLPGKEGLASMTASLLSEGTELHDKLEIAGLLEDNGMGLMYGAGRELSSFSGKCLAEDFPKLVELLAEELRKPAFPAEQVEIVRVQTLNSIQRSEDDTFERAIKLARESLYGAGNPYSRDTLGKKESVSKLTREDVVSFYKENVCPNRIILVVAGDVNADDVVQQVSELFGDWPAGAAQDEKVYEQSLSTQPLNGREETIEMQDRSNATVLFMRKGIRRNAEDYYATMVADHIFGGDFTGRLNGTLRVQEGLTYGSFSMLSSGIGRGPWTIYVQVNPENALKAKDMALKIWREMYEGGATPEEMGRAKSYLTGNFAVRLGTVSAIANLMADMAYYKLGMDYIDRYPQIINSLTLEEVNAAFRNNLATDDYIEVSAGSLPQAEK